MPKLIILVAEMQLFKVSILTNFLTVSNNKFILFLKIDLVFVIFSEKTSNTGYFMCLSKILKKIIQLFTI